MIKDHLAALLREEILSGRLRPGDPIVELQWAPKLGVAQASVREALNILAREGLIQKEPGHSARVTMLSEQDVVHAYQVRAVLEGLAARLVAEKRVDLSDLEQLIAEMRSAAEQNDLRGTIERDLNFHVQLCEKSGNLIVAQLARQILVPLFAFTLIRLYGHSRSAEAWKDSVEDHVLILEAIRSNDPVFAEQSTIHVLRRFARVAQQVWVRQKDTSQRKVG